MVLALANGGLCAAALLLVLPSAPLAAQEAPTMTSWSTAPLRPGDMVRLQIWRDPDLNGDYPIDERGVVTLPLIGPRQATDMDPEAFRQGILTDIGAELRNQDPVVTLLRRVRVLGEVREPGLYHVDPTMLMGDVLALAEGATDEGQLEDIRLIRDGREIRTRLDPSAPISQTLQSGDQITVPKISWLSRNGRWLVGGLISATGLVAAALIR